MTVKEEFALLLKSGSAALFKNFLKKYPLTDEMYRVLIKSGQKKLIKQHLLHTSGQLDEKSQLFLIKEAESCSIREWLSFAPDNITLAAEKALIKCENINIFKAYLRLVPMSEEAEAFLLTEGRIKYLIMFLIRSDVRLSPENETMFVRQENYLLLRRYVRKHQLRKENISFLLRPGVPVYIIRLLIDNAIGDFAPELQSALVNLHNMELLKHYISEHTFDDKTLKELFNSGNEALLSFYIKEHRLNTEMQRYLIRTHRLNLIRLYLELYGFNQQAQEEFLDFMEQKLQR